MENRPVIVLSGRSPTPGANPEVYQRYLKWQTEVYHPLVLKSSALTGIDNYQKIRETPQYPARITILHYQNLNDWRAYGNSPEFSAITQEQRSWVERGILDFIWFPVYGLIQSFRSQPFLVGGNGNTKIENAPFMHMEAYRLSPEEEEKCINWFNEYGCSVFMPLFMKIPGLMGYDRYEITALRRAGREYIEEMEYPRYLSLIYFENQKFFEDFEKSPELAGYLKVLRSVLPRRLKYDWYVQYQLVMRLRK
jgi:heme-degrading monooxygenase HmoA